MNIITIKPKDGERYEIGYQGDHNVNKIVFDIEGEGDYYLKLQLKETEYEPIPIPNKEFPITSTYTQEQCTYEAQILEKDELGDYRKNSPVFKLSLKKSIEETDNVKEVVPPNFQTAYDNMVDITNQIKEAFENGDFNGNGIVSIEKESTSGLTDTYKIIFSDRKETKFNVTNGKGIVSIEKTNTQKNIDTYTITFNDETTSTFTVTNGIDGYSPQVSVQQEVDGVMISVIDNVGTTKAKVLNGTNGKDGTNGKSAYEIAVENGFEGTEEDWLASLDYEHSNEFTELANQVRTDAEQSAQNVQSASQSASESATSAQNSLNSANKAKEEADKAQAIADTLDPIKFAIKETATGNPTIISDSADWRLQKLNVYGQSEQASTTGANLLNLPTGTFTNEEGQLFKVNDDMTVDVHSPVFESGFHDVIINLETPIDVVQGQTNLRLFFDGNISSPASFLLVDAMGSSILSIELGTSYTGIASQTGRATKLYYRQQKTGGVIAKGLKFMVSQSSITDYEPYTGGKPSPSPDYPQEIKNAEISKITICNENLLPLDIDTRSNNDGIYFYQNLGFTLKKGIRYVLSVKSSVTCLYAVPFGETLPDTSPFKVYDGDTVEFTPTETGKYYFNAYNESGITDEQKILWLNIGEKKPYSEHVSEQITLSEPITLRGVFVPSGGNVTIDGQQYIADVITEKDGVIGVERNNGFIENYTNENVGDIYISTTGELSQGASVLYPLSEPTFEPLSEEVQAQYKALKSYYPNTVIQTGCWNDVEYVADTKLYIEKKLSEISSQLTELKADTLLLGGM